MPDLSDTELAARWGRSRAWVQRQARAGRIGYYRVGKSYRFREADVTEYIARHHQQPVITPAQTWGQKTRASRSA